MTYAEQGLSKREAQRRLARNGPNAFHEHRGKSLPETFFEQLRDPLIYVLAVAATVSLLLGEYSDAMIIVAVVLLNALVGTIQEGRAQKALEALKDMQSPKAHVIRDGRRLEIPASGLVEGDLVCLEAGDRVPADLRLVEALGLRAEESALTGEAMPVEKLCVPDGEPQTVEMHGKNLAYMSAMITAGKGKGIVIATGMNTEIGKIADMIRGEKQEPTPLQKRLGELGRILSLLSLFLCAVLFGIAVLQKRDVMQMLLTAISLAVAAVPEGLPAVVTICLALSVTRMVKAGSIVRRLPCVEALGAVNVVCSDKTGTLTLNRMKAELGYWDHELKSFGAGGLMPPKEFLYGMVLCNNAENETGDPTERALAELGRSFGIERAVLEREMPRTMEIPFSSETRMMITVHSWHGTNLAYCKGAPDVVLKKCAERLLWGRRETLGRQDVNEIRSVCGKMAEAGYRVLALAMKQNDISEKGWTFLGMIALGDPPRPEAAGAVELLKHAGVDTVMITGDHAKTALAIGKKLGIAKREAQVITGERLERLSEEDLAREIRRRDLRIFARVTPLQKVQVVKAFQRQGRIVAMTGDGVNDAPSLRAADIGIAMGKNGTDVARQAADLILTDDHFATIERAVEEGRGIYENIRKTVIFLLSSNLGELLTMFTAVALGFMAPLKSCHILWINLITDSLPALALSVDPNDGRALMKHSPRKKGESLFSRGGWECTCFYGILIAVISLMAFSMPLWPWMKEATGLGEKLLVFRAGLEKEAFLVRGQTYAFTVLGMSQLFHAIGMRDVGRSVFRMNHLENKVMLLALAAGMALQVAVTELPCFVKAFGTAHLSLSDWLVLSALAAVPIAAHEIVLLLFGGEGGDADVK